MFSKCAWLAAGQCWGPEGHENTIRFRSKCGNYARNQTSNNHRFLWDVLEVILSGASVLASYPIPTHVHNTPKEKEGGCPNQPKYGYISICSSRHRKLIEVTYRAALAPHTFPIHPQYSGYRMNFSGKSFLISSFSRGQRSIIDSYTTCRGTRSSLRYSGNERGPYWL